MFMNSGKWSCLVGMNSGFVQFKTRAQAELARTKLNGKDRGLSLRGFQQRPLSAPMPVAIIEGVFRDVPAH